MNVDPAEWRKASHSQHAQDCVEVAVIRDRAGVRDSKAREAGQLEVQAAAWRVFLDHL